MGRSCFQLVMLLILVFSVDCYGNWQARGNMSDDNMTIVRQKIDNAMGWFPTRGDDSTAKNISDELNALWGPAWNVIFVINYSSKKSFEAVVNGYAFRDHWLWFNNYTMLELTTSIIIWKDYNCKSWALLRVHTGQLNTTTANHVKFTSDILQSSPVLVTDPWAFSQNLQVKLNTADPNHAYTIVAADEAQINIHGTICVDTEGTALQYGFGAVTATIGGVSKYGLYMIMRTR